MAIKLPASLQQLIDSFQILPGVGPKTAQRMALYLLENCVIVLHVGITPKKNFAQFAVMASVRPNRFVLLNRHLMC